MHMGGRYAPQVGPSPWPLGHCLEGGMAEEGLGGSKAPARKGFLLSDSQVMLTRAAKVTL
jgi:hypothetical protein